ncbi:MAG: hypothetical protein JW820_00580 [Spirochaetales bacterium]|nr:hypothetical protein [Spirochaetales bacterium]
MADHEKLEILPIADNLGDAELTMRVLKKHNPAIRLVHVRARKGPPRW